LSDASVDSFMHQFVGNLHNIKRVTKIWARGFSEKQKVTLGVVEQRLKELLNDKAVDHLSDAKIQECKEISMKKN